MSNKIVRFWGINLLLVTSLLVIGACEDKKDEHFADKNYADADLVQGGLLYDKWWKVNSGSEPTSDFNPIWASQSGNTRSGSTTWRCKECHGWDYIGKDGRYSSGSHYTGFEGVWNVRNDDKTDIFDNIKDEGGDHDFSAVLSDDDVLDLTKFVIDGLADMSLYIDANGAATGDATAGQTLYDSNCATCHGADGNTIDFKSSSDGVQGVGWLANDNPQETLHKIRWGHPGSSMPSMVNIGKSDQDCGDILAYSQTLPEAAFINSNWANADLDRGGLLYDKWWKVNNETEPTTSDFDPIWASQSGNTRSGSTTWRCKECHGWDYIGKDGRYSSGSSHYTGFEGVWTAKDDDKLDIFRAIKDEGGDHDLSAVLSDDDVLDLTKFVADGQVDMSLYIDAGVATGDTTSGQTIYDTNCSSCHGADGNTIDFKSSSEGVQGVGWLANDNPQETLHKIRWGHPGSSMPSMVENGKSDQDCGDILAHGQTLPQ